MVFKSNIPQPSDKLSISQNDLLNNNAQLDATMGVNHFKFSDTSGNTGKHTFAEFPIGSTQVPPFAGAPTVTTNEGAIYTQLATTTGANTKAQLFFTNDNGVNPQNQFQLTRAINNAFTTFGVLLNNYPKTVGNAGTAYSAGWTFLPGGLLMQYGTYLKSPLPASGTIPFIANSSNQALFSSAPFIVIPVLINSGSSTEIHVCNLSNSTTTTAGFTYQTDASSTIASSFVGIQWVAIGL